MLDLPDEKMAQVGGRLSRPLRCRQLTDRRAQHLFGDISRWQTQLPGLSQLGVSPAMLAVEARAESAEKRRLPALWIVQPVAASQTNVQLRRDPGQPHGPQTQVRHRAPPPSGPARFPP